MACVQGTCTIPRPILGGTTEPLNFEGTWRNRMGAVVEVLPFKDGDFPFFQALGDVYYDHQGCAFIKGSSARSEDLMERLSGRAGKVSG